MKKSILVILAVCALLLCACNSEVAEPSTDVLTEGEKTYSFEPGTGTFYYPDDIYNNYWTVEREFDGTAQNVVDILYELDNYDNKLKVNSYYVQGNVLYIDFGVNIIEEAHGGSAKEHFVIQGTCNTLISCFKVKYVRLTVEGQDLKTPHGSYDTFIGYHE